LGANPAVDIRRIRPGEATQLRELRLRALGDAPQAFYSSLEDEEAKPLEQWERQVASLAESGDEAMFVAVRGDEWLGMAGGFRHPKKPETVTGWAGWVDPRMRARGLGLALVGAVADWARTLGASHLEVAVAEDNEPAKAFLERAGFSPTGEVKPVPWDPAVKGIFMERRLHLGTPIRVGDRVR
jgi:RimJ/RimL family protein N-acetyltransferase